MYVCLCQGLTDADLAHLHAAGCRTAEDVSRCTGAGARCGSCRPLVREILLALGARPGVASRRHDLPAAADGAE